VPRLTVKEESAFALAEGVLKLANDLIDAVIPDVIVVGARSPKSLGLALLCRSVSNFTGALIMARENQAIECLTLVRSCFENVLLVVGLCERGAEFVKEMRSDNAANLKTFGKLLRLGPDVAAYTEYIEFIDTQVQRFLAEYAEKKPAKLKLDEASKHFFSACAAIGRCPMTRPMFRSVRWLAIFRRTTRPITRKREPSPRAR
jgi:hypothetical protein